MKPRTRFFFTLAALVLLFPPADAGDRAPHYRMESGPIDFGRLVPGVAAERPDAVRVRVFSDRRWVLKLIADAPPVRVDRPGTALPPSRVAWRSGPDAGFAPISAGRPIVVARGAATSPLGHLVRIDLRMELSDLDDIGRYGWRYRVELEAS